MPVSRNTWRKYTDARTQRQLKKYTDVKIQGQLEKKDLNAGRARKGHSHQDSSVTRHRRRPYRDTGKRHGSLDPETAGKKTKKPGSRDS